MIQQLDRRWNPGQCRQAARARATRAGSRRKPNCFVAAGSAAPEVESLIRWPRPKSGLCRLSKCSGRRTRAKYSASPLLLSLISPQPGLVSQEGPACDAL